MTTEPTIQSVNKVIVIGDLDTMRVRGRQRRDAAEATVVERRNQRGGKEERLSLQVRSPYGGAFALPIEIAPHVPGAELLEGAAAGTALAVEGELQLRRHYDARYAQRPQDPGREMREMHLRVTAIRHPAEGEQSAGSAVWLEGQVLEPPRVLRHPELPSIQLAMTLLEVTMERPSPYPGSRAVTVERVQVNVAIPTSHEHAPLLYRQGNQVRVEGHVECMLEGQRGAAVEQAIAALDAAWEQQRAGLADQGAEARAEERRYLARRRRLGEAPRVFILAGFAELLGGEPGVFEELRSARREFLRAWRRQRAARQERWTAGEQVGARSQVGDGEAGIDGDVGDERQPAEQRESSEPVVSVAPLIQASLIDNHALSDDA